MRYWVFLLFGLFLLSFVEAANTESNVTFNVGGCYIPDGPGYNVPTDSCYLQDDDGYGEYYCDVFKGYWRTREPGYGCSMGKIDYLSEAGDPFCCPDLFFCNETDNGDFKCDRMLDNCLDQLDRTACLSEGMGCIWLEQDARCVVPSAIKALGCEYYNTSADCIADDLNLVELGLGSEIFDSNIECNGEAFGVSNESKCVWDPLAVEGKKCHINYVAEQILYSGVGSSPKFSCSNTYSLGDCIDGVQDVTWISTSPNEAGFSEPVLAECLAALGCDNGTATRFCGEPTIKLPGFSLFSFLASLSIIGIFYFVMKSSKA